MGDELVDMVVGDMSDELRDAGVLAEHQLLRRTLELRVGERFELRRVVLESVDHFVPPVMSTIQAVFDTLLGGQGEHQRVRSGARVKNIERGHPAALCVT